MSAATPPEIQPAATFRNNVGFESHAPPPQLTRLRPCTRDSAHRRSSAPHPTPPRTAHRINEPLRVRVHAETDGRVKERARERGAQPVPQRGDALVPYYPGERRGHARLTRVHLHPHLYPPPAAAAGNPTTGPTATTARACQQYSITKCTC